MVSLSAACSPQDVPCLLGIFGDPNLRRGRSREQERAAEARKGRQQRGGEVAGHRGRSEEAGKGRNSCSSGETAEGAAVDISGKEALEGTF
jgi:hypothetical protein